MGGRGTVHCVIHILHLHIAVDLLHGRAGVLHRDQGLLVDVGGFYRVDLLLEHRDLAVGLLQRGLVLLLSFQGVSGGWRKREVC